MIKQIGNVEKAIKSLQTDKNNAVSFVYEGASNSKGPLENVTITLKSNYATNDISKSEASSQILKTFNAHYDAAIVEKLKKAGAAIVGKTHCDEFGLGGSGLLSSWGEITNPLDSTRMVGGSSSGAAATLNDHITLAIGSDTGNSVRLPASFVGKVGYKPSYGAVSRYGLFAFASSLDTVGWLSHNVNDSIALAQVLFGRDERDMTSKDIELPTFNEVKPKSVAFINDHNKLSKRVKASYDKLFNDLKNEGIKVEVINIDELILKQIDTVYEVVAYSEASSNLANYTGIIFGNREEGKTWDDIVINSRSKNLGKMVQRRFTLGSFYLQKENQVEIFQYAQKVRRLIKNTYDAILNKFDVVVFPTTTAAPKIKDGKADGWHVDYSGVSNLIGTPSISIPFTKDESMPVGLLIDSKIYNDKNLLSHALFLEKFIGGKYE